MKTKEQILSEFSGWTIGELRDNQKQHIISPLTAEMAMEEYSNQSSPMSEEEIEGEWQRNSHPFPILSGRLLMDSGDFKNAIKHLLGQVPVIPPMSEEEITDWINKNYPFLTDPKTSDVRGFKLFQDFVLSRSKPVEDKPVNLGKNSSIMNPHQFEDKGEKEDEKTPCRNMAKGA
jgi:hypothetical protein